jgi:hypothetical protein
MLNLRNILSVLRAQYDKIAAGLVLLLLLLTVAYLAVSLGGMQKTEADFAAKLEDMTPEHAHALAADVSPYRAAKLKMLHPVRLADWTNALFVPETRVWCVDCRQPIPFVAKVCPFCKQDQPIPKHERPTRDLDQDGMWDVWEMEHGLNPNDPSDARRDPDDDGFTSLEEFRGNPRSDPMDANDHPPIGAKLHVKSISADPFRLLFKSVLKLPDGSLKFAINTRGDTRTYFKKLGEEIGGFVLEKYEQKFVEEERGGVKRKVNRSVLTLKRGSKLIPLTMGRRVSYVELTAVLVFSLDDSEYTLKMGGILDLKGTKYKVIRIDSRSETVVIESLPDRRRLEIRR